MTVGDRLFIGAAVLAIALITSILALAGLSPWLGIAICLPAAGGAFALKVHLENTKARQPRFVAMPPPPAPPAPPAGEHVQGLSLPSADSDYRFLLHGHVRWRPLPGALDPHRQRDAAVDAVLQRAYAITQQVPPSEHDLVRARLAAELGLPAADAHGRVEAWLEDVAVHLTDDDLQRLHRLAEVRKNEQVWEHERQHERNKRAYLRDDVLETPGSAVVWWLAQDTSRVEGTVALIDSLAKLSAAAHDRPHAEIRAIAPPLPAQSVETHVRHLIDALIPAAEEPAQAELADRIARLATTVGADDEAQRIRLAFNAPDLFTVLDETAPDAGEPGA